MKGPAFVACALLALGGRAVAQAVDAATQPPMGSQPVVDPNSMANASNDTYAGHVPIDAINDLINQHTPTPGAVPQKCPPGEFMDCDDKCFPAPIDGGCKVYGLQNSENCTALIGDYVCDQGQRILSSGQLGPNLYCARFNWDNRDCDCTGGRTMTCSGYCLSDADCVSSRWLKNGCQDWLLDNVCDYGQRISDAGITMHFECSRFNFDNFACDENATCLDFDINNLNSTYIDEACPAPEDQRYVAFPTSYPTEQPTSFPTQQPTFGNCKSDEIDEIEVIVQRIETSLNAHTQAFQDFMDKGKLPSSDNCADDYYARIQVTPSLHLYCDELDDSYGDCDIQEAKEKCCKTCCLQHNKCA